MADLDALGVALRNHAQAEQERNRAAIAVAEMALAGQPEAAYAVAHAEYRRASVRVAAAFDQLTAAVTDV